MNCSKNTLSEGRYIIVFQRPVNRKGHIKATLYLKVKVPWTAVKLVIHKTFNIYDKRYSKTSSMCAIYSINNFVLSQLELDEEKEKWLQVNDCPAISLLSSFFVLFFFLYFEKGLYLRRHLFYTSPDQHFSIKLVFFSSAGTPFKDKPLWP